MNRGSFNRAEAAVYELLSAPAVRTIVSPVLTEAVVGAPRGLVLDVGCGSGALTEDLRDGEHDVIGTDPSVPQLRRLRRRGGAACVAAPAGALPFPSGAFAAVVSSCSIKHWPSLPQGLSECVRVLSPGGVLAVVEIDGGRDPDDLVRFAARSRVPRGFHRVYRVVAKRSFVALTPDPIDLSERLIAAGLEHVGHGRVAELPFFVVTARKKTATAS